MRALRAAPAILTAIARPSPYSLLDPPIHLDRTDLEDLLKSAASSSQLHPIPIVDGRVRRSASNLKLEAIPGA